MTMLRGSLPLWTRSIYEGLGSPKLGLAKPITKLLPIVCILTPQPNLEQGVTPPPDSSLVEMIAAQLTARVAGVHQPRPREAGGAAHR